MSIAYAGLPGAFAHEACMEFVPEHEPLPCPSFESVVAAVLSGEAALGMLPVTNNEAGETGASALIEAAGLAVRAEHELPVRMHLIGLPGSSIEAVRTVVSHPVALRQCAAHLAALDVATVEMSNTAVAAAGLSNPTRAVLASEAAAEIYGLAILQRDMHDRPDNATRFAVVARPASGGAA